MSDVTSITLQFSCCEASTERSDGYDDYAMLDKINDWLFEREQFPIRQPFKEREEANYNGDKCHVCPTFLYATRFNIGEDFAEFLCSLPWLRPECVIVLIDFEHVDSTKGYRPNYPGEGGTK